MSNISAGTSIQGLGFNAQTSTNDKILGKDDFLKLLITQLNYQDPLNPMKGTEFSAQLAQFSSVEQLQNIHQELKNSIDANYLLTTSINNTLAATVIGKTVKATGNQIYLGESGEATLHYDLSSKAKKVTIEILDENDQVKRTITLDNVGKGEQSYTWDGKDNAGIALGQGTYHFRVKASDEEGNPVSVQTYMVGTITGVCYGYNGAELLVGDLTLAMSDVYEILE